MVLQIRQCLGRKILHVRVLGLAGIFTEQLDGILVRVNTDHAYVLLVEGGAVEFFQYRDLGALGQARFGRHFDIFADGSFLRLSPTVVCSSTISVAKSLTSGFELFSSAILLALTSALPASAALLMKLLSARGSSSARAWWLSINARPATLMAVRPSTLSRLPERRGVAARNGGRNVGDDMRFSLSR